MWIGAGGDFVLCHDGEQLASLTGFHANQARSHVSTLAEESDGTVWAGSAGGGLLQFKDGKFCRHSAGKRPGGQSD